MTTIAPDRRLPSQSAPRHARPPSSVRSQILTAASAVLTLALGIGAILVPGLCPVRGAR